MQDDMHQQIPQPILDIAEKGFAARMGLDLSHFHGLLKQAEEKLRSGNAEAAFKTFASLLLFEPRNVELQLALGQSAMAIGHNEIALQAASVVIALEPDDARGWLMSGQACLAMGEPDLAREDLTKAATMDADAPIRASAERILNAISTNDA